MGLSIKGNEGDTVLRHLKVFGAGYLESGAGGAISIESGPVRMENVVLEDSFDCGLLVMETGRVHASSQTVRISKSGGPGICANVQSVQTLNPAEFTLADNGMEGVWLHGSAMVGAQHWRDWQVPYIVTESFALDDGHLVIDPGVTVAFEPYYSMVVGRDEETEQWTAGLDANGTAEAPVTFTSLGEERGGWGGLQVEQSAGSGRVVLTHTLLENGGSESATTTGLLSGRNGARIRADHLSLRGSEGLGFSFSDEAGFNSDSVGIEVTDNAAAGEMDAEVVGDLPLDTSLSGNDSDVVFLSTGALMTSATWNALGAVYQPDETIRTETVGSEPIVLTLEAGVNILFPEATELEIGTTGPAGFYAMGTEESPVVLTSAAAEPEAGAWGGVQLGGGIDEGSAAVAHTRIVWAGETGDGAALRLDGAVLSATSLDIRGSAGYGAMLRGGGFSETTQGLTLTENAISAYANMEDAHLLPADGSTFTGNEMDHVVVNGSLLGASASWSALGVPYFLEDSVRIYGSEETSTTLTLAAGVEVAFDEGGFMRVDDYGALQAVGTESEPVRFGVLDPTSGVRWSGLVFEDGDSASTLLDHVDVGGGGSEDAAIVMTRSSPTIRNTHIHDSACWAIWISGADLTPVLENITYADNVCGDLTYDLN